MPPINNVVKGELKGQFGDIVKRPISILKYHCQFQCPRGRIHKFHMEEENLNNPNLSYASRLVPNTINLVKVTQRSSSSCNNSAIFMADFNLQLKTFNTGSRISHVGACTSMGYAHSSYAHIVFQMSLAHWIKFEPKSYTDA